MKTYMLSCAPCVLLCAHMTDIYSVCICILCVHIIHTRCITTHNAQDFDTTAGKHVEDERANAGAVKTESKRSARQYMNRKVCRKIIMKVYVGGEGVIFLFLLYMPTLSCMYV